MKNLLIITLISLYGLNLYSQDEPKVVVFNSPKTERQPSDVTSLLKFGMLEPFSGTFSVYYERVLTDKISAEVGLGLTIDDYLNIAINGLDDLFNEGPRQPKIGQAFSLGVRYYPGIVPEEFYVAPEFRFKRYVNTFTYEDATGLPVVENESRSISIGRLSFGYHYLVQDNIFWDFYGGFGIGQEKGQRYEQFYNDVTEEFEYQNIVETGLTPRLHIGIKLGIGF